MHARMQSTVNPRTNTALHACMRTNPYLNLAVSFATYMTEKSSTMEHHRGGELRSERYIKLATTMDRRRHTFAAVAATVCLVFAHGVTCGAAARPLARRRPVDTMTTVPYYETVMDVSAAAAPEGSVRWERGADEVLGAGKWLPLPLASALAGGLRFPGVLPAAGASMPWLAGAPPALAGPGLPLVPPYIGATRQEQLSLWASLFNPFQVRPRLPGAADSSVPAERVPAVATGGLERSTTVDEPAAAAGVQVAEPKWGVFLGATPNNNG